MIVFHFGFHVLKPILTIISTQMTTFLTQKTINLTQMAKIKRRGRFREKYGFSVIREQKNLRRDNYSDTEDHYFDTNDKQFDTNCNFEKDYISCDNCKPYSDGVSKLFSFFILKTIKNSCCILNSQKQETGQF